MPIEGFQGLPWLNQVELAHHVAKTFVEELHQRKPWVNDLTAVMAKAMVEELGKERIATIIRTAVRDEVRAYLEKAGLDVSLGSSGHNP